MNHTIEAYYSQAKVNPHLLKQKLEKFSRNPDLQKEFAYWIEHRAFMADSVVIHGYTAEKLAALSEYLNGEGAFMLMIELRENPNKALKRISDGFFQL